MRIYINLMLVAFALLVALKTQVEAKAVQFTESIEQRQETRERREADAEAVAFPVAESPCGGEERPRPTPRPARSAQFSESIEKRQETLVRERREPESPCGGEERPRSTSRPPRSAQFSLSTDKGQET